MLKSTDLSACDEDGATHVVNSVHMVLQVIKLTVLHHHEKDGHLPDTENSITRSGHATVRTPTPPPPLWA